MLSPKKDGGVSDGDAALVDAELLTLRIDDSRSARQHGFAVARKP